MAIKYNPRLKALVVPTSDLDQAHYLIRYALRQMRQCADLPLTRYEREASLTNHDHAAISIIEMGINMGIDFEVTPHNHNKLDLTDV